MKLRKKDEIDRKKSQLNFLSNSCLKLKHVEVIIM